MKKNNFLSFMFMWFLIIPLSYSQTTNKLPLDHSVYDSWRNLAGYQISNDGNWVSYEINPQQGDGYLYIYNARSKKLDSIPRGYKAKFSFESKYLVFQIKPQYLTTRQAKKDKKKKDDMPKDSLGIWMLENATLSKVEKVKSFQVPEKGGEWFAYHREKIIPEEKKKEKTEEEEELSEEEKNAAKEEAKKLKEEIKNIKKAKGTDLVIFNPLNNNSKTFSDITNYSVSKYGKIVGFIEHIKDSLDYSKTFVFNTKKAEAIEIFGQEGIAKKVVADEAGKQLGFLHSGDTAKVKVYSLYHWSEKNDKATLAVDTLNESMPQQWSVSEFGAVRFSDNGKRLFFGTALKPMEEPEDTLLDSEKYQLDIWSWQDPTLQPMQKLNVKREKEKNYLAVYYPDAKKMIQLATEEVPIVRPNLKGNGDLALGVSNLPYRKEASWDANRYQDIYLVNFLTGEKKMLLKKAPSGTSLSPNGKYLVWYEVADSNMYSMPTSSNESISLTSKIPVAFYNELHDSPSDPRPYGYAGWIEDDEYILLYDRFDIWKMDPSGKQEPVNLTAGNGRKNNIRFRYVKLDREADFIGKKEDLILSAFQIYTKQAGFYQVNASKSATPEKLIMADFSFSPPLKAKEADKLIWRKGSFEVYNDLWVSDLTFKGEKQISLANPQQSDYNWGTVELVEWLSFNNEKLQGLLYKPENFDPKKKYPMLVYFYERSSDGLHRHQVPAPSRSTINRSYCVSNEYLIFVPDIPYRVGYPGQSAYNAIVSGTMALVDRYDFINKDKLGLNGQSWGGYQIAYLVTQTDLYACAFSGAPVSNMTSAYGGIRWGSGMSRMFQYEQTQSRIGGTLWEKPIQYIENSPIFFVPKINTPLLIMHNDADGAVPWYQGIEFFVALRRLNKPAWMLSYNKEAHNLRKRPNTKDLVIRMMQFYDHYMKDKPAPEWMVKGLPAIDKGKKDAYDLMDE